MPKIAPTPLNRLKSTNSPLPLKKEKIPEFDNILKKG